MTTAGGSHRPGRRELNEKPVRTSPPENFPKAHQQDIGGQWRSKGDPGSVDLAGRGPVSARLLNGGPNIDILDYVAPTPGPGRESADGLEYRCAHP
ncbi:hypothetical protein GCM10010123_37090 [Pilimelia anulata]|uniref:Uncharacterized protein n=1 Tax=Pilimelia anulata TaxID=53371 RepID=A0A8J3B9E4_9ACTN|nr:hypothetical protein [Pilimelia anulata]GGK03747.1 hypothetical protein GCM10010123_37090 [Pilimelia anulata]